MATYVGDTPLIKYDCGEDITDLATTPKLHYAKPDGTTGNWTPNLSTRYVQYQTVTGDIDQAGLWLFQPELSDGTKIFFGDITQYYVSKVLV